MEKTGPLSFRVETAGGNHIRCHADQVRKTRCSDARDSSEDVEASEAVVPEEVVPEGSEVFPNVVENPEVGRCHPARERHTERLSCMLLCTCFYASVRMRK